jgi:hypothetical protein
MIDRYLDRVLLYAEKPEPESQTIRQELKERLWEKVENLTADGLPKEEAILEVLSQQGHPRVAARRLNAPFPWLDIRNKGVARGVLAIGPRAIGIVAIGWWAVGIFAIGVLTLGVFSLGVVSFGVFSAGGLPSAWVSVWFGAEGWWGMTAPITMMWLAAIESPPEKGVRMEADWLADGARLAPEPSQPAALGSPYEDPY